jgi:uncharacterized protein YaiE (UPF0345 family)
MAAFVAESRHSSWKTRRWTIFRSGRNSCHVPPGGLTRGRPRRQSRRMSLPTSFSGVTVHTKANLYFDGRVVSHTVLMPDGAKKTLGLIYPGSYHFGTGAPERMEIVAGACRVTLDGATAVKDYPAGTFFDVPGKSGFTIEVKDGICEYICSFL